MTPTSPPIGTSITTTDLVAIFLLGAAIATGNPATAPWGILAILLPALIALGYLGLGANGLNVPKLVHVMCWTAAAYVAFIFLWYEQYKLLGHPGSVALFTTLTDWAGFPGYEKVMRLGVGIAEIIASGLILFPATQGLGALGALALMTGAIFFHVVTPLGVDPYKDGGLLFKEACAVWTCSWLVIWWRREQIRALMRWVGIRA
ncbi:MAG: hypothetical protein NW216_02005 [Hyphomicrobium sp.]|nr:hypothetical protein [Hyphomicrobium sp.]